MPTVNFKTNGKWSGCMRMDAAIRQFQVTFDEPPSLGGEDTAPNPVEVLLSSLLGCLGIVTCIVAGERGYALEGVEIDVEGGLDPRGFMGQDSDVRSGLSTVRYTVKIKGDLDAKELDDFCREVERRCPVSDTMKNGTSVEGQFVMV